MALDGVYLYSIVNELNQHLIGAKVEKINQPEKDEIILTLRSNRENKKLLISASSSYPRIHFTAVNKVNPLKAPMFCMLLRKYLSGAKIKSIEQVDMDRILLINFESTDEMGFDSIYSLIIEIMGRHSNITLIRNRDNIIMDSIKHITPEVNSFRSILPGIKYLYPPSSNKLNPISVTKEEVLSYLVSKDKSIINENSASSTFTGVSKLLSKEIYNKFKACDYTEEDINSFASICLEYFNSLKELDFKFQCYIDSKSLKEFYCINLDTMDSYKSLDYSSASELLEAFYREKDKQDRLNNRSIDLQKLINHNLDRCSKKLDILNHTLNECNNKEDYKIKGELLTANIYSLKKGYKEVKLLNYYAENEEYISIDLDENKTPSENIQSYYKKYNKYKKSEEAAKEQLKITEDEIDYLNSVMTSIRNADSYEEIEDIKKELIETGYIKFKKHIKENKKVSKPLHFISSDGIDIYVGKNNLQNDYLTLKFADKQDLWFHTKNIPGSHVIIKGRNIPDSTLLEAATLAAYYSKSKDSSNVPVDYTEIKNVKKPSGAKPGMVIYYTNKTVYVTPKDLNLKRV